MKSLQDFDGGVGKSERKPLSGRRALVIGGTGGIGKEIALLLAGAGANITLHGGSSRERLALTLDAIYNLGGKADGFLCRIDGVEAIDRIFSEYSSCVARAAYISRNERFISETCYSPDILVYAYGPFKRAVLNETSAADWQFLTQQNLTLPGYAVSRVLPSMLERKWGRILLFGGTNTDAIRGFVSTAAYSSAKTGLGVLAKSVAKAAGGAGVTCNVICPGLTDTEYADETVRAYNRAKSPAGKALSPKMVALTAMYVLANRSINGAVIPVDEGVVV
ncbi:MAG: SDR family NAD(P)-dependent oxidoreductase [Treponema sp.]|jgi:NAD(P)-dependent dehydrogenase (short-subunit alcohol dehydrogenase family)|nr:SDR family NAD(P)-dependent oxidoreductase [Treponema sp.]